LNPATFLPEELMDIGHESEQEVLQTFATGKDLKEAILTSSDLTLFTDVCYSL
jgi:hypothetical protein